MTFASSLPSSSRSDTKYRVIADGNSMMYKIGFPVSSVSDTKYRDIAATNQLPREGHSFLLGNLLARRLIK